MAGHRGVGTVIGTLLDELGCEVVPVDARVAREVAEAHHRWGKGVHPARLNLGDCFAYALAKSRQLPLLYIGGDFSQTDIASAML